MMDLYITITDENDDVLRQVNIWQDGSDRQGANEIADWVLEKYNGAEDISEVPRQISHDVNNLLETIELLEHSNEWQSKRIETLFEKVQRLLRRIYC